MEKKAMREGYGETLVKLGKENENIVVLDADLSGSTKTAMFAKEFPERFFNMGIAEQDMIATASGLATVGKIPFASSFAMFATGRAWEIVRQAVCLGNKNVKICATHGGITVGEDGATHQALEDIALMRVLPNMSVIVPADYYEAKKAVEFAAEYKGPVYIRMTRSATPVIFDENYSFDYGKVRVLKEGSDITVFACGVMVAESLKAAELLEEKGISAKVVNVSTIKPIDVEGIVNAVSDTKLAVTVEEHNIIGGLGGAISEVLSENYPVKIKRIGMEDKFGRSGKAGDLLVYFGLDGNSIAKKIEEFYNSNK
ncbi:transketolase [Thermotomaculum hydrothermale]|uniref:Transketolase n=1 Tax=Thermotomaculum hydrothermale TaxID=981385 RepID=A0A7R6T0G3_9BACT|nr:transketolase family protein [Thermotomaculum hydrothermale]BBB33662.1 transketolase [Thermotomaculum hydrothermale]